MTTHTHIQFESSATVDGSPLEFPQEVEDARQAVMSNTDPTTWVIYRYKPKTNIIEVYETGEGHCEEMLEELLDGQPQFIFMNYAYDDSVSKKSKLVYFSYVPDDVPAVKKGQLHTHAEQMGQFLQGFHIQINARNEDDITDEIVMQKIKMTSHY